MTGRSAGVRKARLAQYCAMLFSRTRQRWLLELSIKLFEEGLPWVPEGRPWRAIALSDFGMAKRGWFELTSDRSALDDALCLGRQAVTLSQATQPAQGSGITLMSPLGLSLSNLGVTLHVKFEAQSDPAALDEGITVSQAAVEATAEEDPRLAMRMNYLGLALFRRYEWTGDTQALREAIHWNRESVSAAWATAASGGPPPRADGSRPTRAERRKWRETFSPREEIPFYQATLGMALQQWSGAEHDRKALEEAVKVGMEAVANTRNGHYRRSEFLSYVAGAWRAGYLLSGSPQDVRRAVEFSRAAVKDLRPADRRRGALQGDLALCLTDLFEAVGDTNALLEAVTLLREAARQPGQDGSVQAKNKMLYGQVLLTAAEVSADTYVVREAGHQLAVVVEDPTAGVMVQVMAGRDLARANRLVSKHAAALAAAEQAVERLPKLAPQQLRRRDREHRLGSIAGIAAEAAAAALGARRPERAVELLEQARGVLLGEAMAGRSDLARLRARDPGLTREFEALRNQLAGYDTQAPIPDVRGRIGKAAHGMAAAQAASRREADAQWDSLLARIRAIFPDFLAAPDISTLARQAADGPIVMVTSTRDRSDALIVTSDPRRPVRPLLLAADTDAKAREHIGVVLGAFSGVGGTGLDAAVTSMLGWAWDAIAAPVLHYLYEQSLLAPAAGQRWPRLWWCPVGALAQIPLHAAGHYTGPGPRESVLDWAVSSYAPTIRSLKYARYSPEWRAASSDASLIVAVPEVPRRPGEEPVLDLPGACDEARRLSKVIPGARVLYGERATVANVTGALSLFPVAHFACHCVVDVHEPGQSGLVLYDRKERGLTVAEISGLDLAGAGLAYLSACETTATPLPFSDEALHVTGAFLLAGYRGVIGTLWPVLDEAALGIAEQVYVLLTGNSRHPPHTRLSAAALHEAIRARSASDPGRPSRWASHIHVGG